MRKAEVRLALNAATLLVALALCHRGKAGLQPPPAGTYSVRANFPSARHFSRFRLDPGLQAFSGAIYFLAHSAWLCAIPEPSEVHEAAVDAMGTLAKPPPVA